MTGPAIGVDLGGSHLRVARCAPDGTVEGAPTKDAIAGRSFEDITAVLAHRVQALGDGPVGVACAAMLSPDGTVVKNAPNLGWRDLPVAARWRAALGRDVALLNDVDAICLGEATAGAGRGHDDVLCVMWGSGLGTGAVCGGRLLRGAQGVAMELGHVLVEPGGRTCGCGRQGCLEAYVGGHALEARVQDDLDAGRVPAPLRGAVGSRPWIVPLIEAAAEDRVGYAASLWDEVAARVGLAVAHAVTLLNPGVLLLGGGVLDHAPSLGRRLATVLDEVVHPPARCARRAPALGDRAGIIGAAVHARSAPGG